MRGYFFVFKRTLQSGNKIFYYQAYKPDGTLSTARSTGCIRKREAVKFCEFLLMGNFCIKYNDNFLKQDKDIFRDLPFKYKCKINKGEYEIKFL